MSKTFSKHTSISFISFLLTLSAVSNAHAKTATTGNENFTLAYNTDNGIENLNVQFSDSYLANNPNMDSFWLVATPNNIPEKSVKLIGDLKTNTISAYTYHAGSSVSMGNISSTNFNDSVITQHDGYWQVYQSGQNIIDGWNATAATVDVHGSKLGWFDGTVTNHIDLDGDYEGGQISKTLKTEIGKTYEVSFDYSKHPGAGAVNQPRDFVFSDGTNTTQFTADASTPTGWKSGKVSFTATSDETTISFKSINSTGSYGALLDNIEINTNPLLPDELLGVAYGAIRPDGTGFSLDLTEINKKIADANGQKFGVDETAFIAFKAGKESDFVYDGENIARYNPIISNVSKGDGFERYNAQISDSGNNNNPVSEPTGLLISLTALGLMLIKSRRKIS